MAGGVLEVLPAQEARTRLLAGRVTAPLSFRGKLDLSGELGLTHLPAGLRGDILDVSGTGLTTLPEDLQVGELIARNLPITRVPSSLKVVFRLTLDGCTHLQVLPAGLSVGALNLQDCLSLERLPEGLDVCFLNLSRCDALIHWPQQGQIRYGHLSVRDCRSLRGLPDWLAQVAQLDVSGCPGITALPPGLRISGWLDVAGSGLSALPAGQRVSLRWRGVRIDERVAFEPGSLSGAEILAQPNTEVRRVMMERVGYERFLNDVRAEVIDQDRDAGGERRLLRVELPEDEPFVAVQVACPSTGRSYVLRVPPTIRTGQAASAWLAGFDDPARYQPAAEA